MEKLQSKTTRKERSRKSQQKTQILEDILEEYCLKRNSFNPTHPSPNIFIGKLEYRMKKYYNNLYKSDILFTE
jgi:hypothetical protein